MTVLGTFTAHFMDFCVQHLPMEVSTRFFEVFLLEGEDAYLNVIVRMMDLRQEEIFARNDVSLQ